MSTQSGTRSLRTPANITAAVPTGASVDVTGDVYSISLINTGTLDNAASLALQGQINGSSFFPLFYPGTTTPITFTGTQINAGLLTTINVKCLQIRGVLTPATTSGSNGVIMRVLD
jgi:hypothetical protein